MSVYVGPWFVSLCLALVCQSMLGPGLSVYVGPWFVSLCWALVCQSMLGPGLSVYVSLAYRMLHNSCHTTRDGHPASLFTNIFTTLYNETFSTKFLTLHQWVITVCIHFMKMFTSATLEA